MELPTMSKSAYVSSVVDSTAFLGLGGGLGQRMPDQAIAQMFQQQVQPKEQSVSNARIVKVFIADTNENIPLEKRVLYSGDEKLTDLTDQELFFDINVAEVLSKHNEYRKTVVDKKQAEKFGRDMFLEPARIRDLRMVVVDVAKF
jgi:hypothetical protein